MTSSETRVDDRRDPARDQRDRAEIVEEKLTVPVIVAAVASVPAIFLTMLDGTAAAVGTTLNYASLAVLTAETAILFVLAGDRSAWLKKHWWIAAVAVVSVPAVIFAVGPVQLLRLVRVVTALRFVRVVGALRIIRVHRIIKAGRILRERAGLTGRLGNAVVLGITLACAAFVTLILSDPTSQTRQLLDGTLEQAGPSGVIVAGVILAGATFVVVRNKRAQAAEARNEASGDGGRP